MEKSEIQEFYKDANVLVTGGTGFMGKVLIEKLLRDTEVTTVYVLIRDKKGKNPHSRIDDLFDDTVFTRVKSERPKCKNRVEAVAGDCGIAGLGLSIEDRHKLISKVHVVFHVAATVNFEEPIKMAYNINVNGTRQVVELAREMNHLKAMIHVSTAYCNCIRGCIDEKIYNHPVKYDDLQRILDKLSVEEAQVYTEKILGKWPNTYTFTKALAESMLEDVGKCLPLGIFRPGIVMSTYREPIEAWIDNIYGPTGVAYSVMSGVIRTIPCNKENLADVVPVDTCISAVIAAAWDVAESKRKGDAKDIPVYNYVSSPENPISWGEIFTLSYIHGLGYPTSKTIWTWMLYLTNSKLTYGILKVVLHIFPGFLMDLVRVLSGKKPKVLTIYKKVHKFLDAVAYFSVRQFQFSNKNTQSLWLKLNKTDQVLFPFSMTTVHWLLYLRRYAKGIRLYLMKDPDSTLEYSRRRYRRLEKIDMAFKMTLTFLVCMVISSIFSSIFNLVFTRGSSNICL